MRPRGLHILVRVALWLNVAALLGAVLALRLVGERWWPTFVLLYLPRIGFAVPLALLAPVGVWVARRSSILPLTAATVLVLFPLMGIEIAPASLRSGGAADGEVIRLLTFNVDSGKGLEVTAERVAALEADVVVLQDVDDKVEARMGPIFQGRHLHRTGQFFLASRFPLRAVEVGDRGMGSAAGFVHYTLDTPLGAIELFSAHLLTPRDALEELRGEGLRHLAAKGLSEKTRAEVTRNLERRQRQVTALAEAAGRARGGVLIAGDLNLAGLSPVLHEVLGRFQDGYAKVGNGFGYTFPVRKGPWLRLDRILAGEELSFRRIEVGPPGGSDHLPILAEIGRR